MEGIDLLQNHMVDGIDAEKHRKYRGHGLQNATKTWQVFQKGWNCSWKNYVECEMSASNQTPSNLVHVVFQRAILPIYLDITKRPAALQLGDPT